MRHNTAAAPRRSQEPLATDSQDATPGHAPRQNAKSAIEVHFNIRRLTIEGYSSAGQERFTRSLRAHLSALAQDAHQHQWSSANGLAMDRLDAGGLAPGATPETAARQIATRIFAGLAQAGVLRK
jgi:hypothetical protein